MNNLFYILITLVFLCLSLVYVKNTLHVFQQNRYEFYRYTEWLFDNNNIQYSNALVYVVLSCQNIFLSHHIQERKEYMQ